MSAAPPAKEHAVPAWIGSALTFVGWSQRAEGLFLVSLMLASFWDAQFVLEKVLGVPASLSGPGMANTWAQVAVVFGMHSYADWYVGGLTIARARDTTLKNPGLPPLVTVWNQARFIISMLWGLLYGKGVYEANQGATFNTGSVVLLSVLLFDTVVVRPLGTYAGRYLNDICPPEKRQIERETAGMGPVERFCRGVFLYEGVLSGTTGAVYMLIPEIYLWLYGMPAIDTVGVRWAFSQFGVLVMTFGFYQQSAEIDGNSMMVLWWLILDVVWMWFFYLSVKEFAPRGEFGFWHHAAFQADFSLAAARTVILFIRWFFPKRNVNNEKKSE